jgi:hypothetical protein
MNSRIYTVLFLAFVFLALQVHLRPIDESVDLNLKKRQDDSANIGTSNNEGYWGDDAGENEVNEDEDDTEIDDEEKESEDVDDEVYDSGIDSEVGGISEGDLLTTPLDTETDDQNENDNDLDEDDNEDGDGHDHHEEDDRGEDDHDDGHDEDDHDDDSQEDGEAEDKDGNGSDTLEYGDEALVEEEPEGLEDEVDEDEEPTTTTDDSYRATVTPVPSNDGETTDPMIDEELSIFATTSASLLASAYVTTIEYETNSPDPVHTIINSQTVVPGSRTNSAEPTNPSNAQFGLSAYTSDDDVEDALSNSSPASEPEMAKPRTSELIAMLSILTVAGLTMGLLMSKSGRNLRQWVSRGPPASAPIGRSRDYMELPPRDADIEMTRNPWA